MKPTKEAPRRRWRRANRLMNFAADVSRDPVIQWCWDHVIGARRVAASLALDGMPASRRVTRKRGAR